MDSVSYEPSLFPKLLKGQCHEIFCFWFFSWISFPPAPEYSIKTFRIFSKSRCTTGINDNGGKFFSQFSLCCWYRWQICRQCQRYLRQISHRCQLHQRQICHWCERHRWKTMWTLTKLLTTENEHENFFYLYAYSTTQRCPKEIIKKILMEDFFHLAQVSTTPVVHLELRKSPRIFEKIRNSPIGIIRGLGELINEAKNLVTLSL